VERAARKFDTRTIPVSLKKFSLSKISKSYGKLQYKNEDGRKDVSLKL
jgi:hypothetical protein